MSRIALFVVKRRRTDRCVIGINPMRMVAVIVRFNARINFDPTAFVFPISVITYADDQLVDRLLLSSGRGHFRQAKAGGSF